MMAELIGPKNEQKTNKQRLKISRVDNKRRLIPQGLNF